MESKFEYVQRGCNREATNKVLLPSKTFHALGIFFCPAVA
jgi:hypothetical protein